MGKRPWFDPKHLNAALLLFFLGLVLINPNLSYADVESSLNNIRSELTGVILPVLSVIGLGIASVSFFTGNPNAKQHVVYAILGCALGFGAQQIVNFISGMVR